MSGRQGPRPSPAADPMPADALPPSRPRCAACGLPRATCLCALAAPVDNRVPLLVLQHPREAREAKGSARLLARCLARCRVVVGDEFDDAALAPLLHGDGRRSVLLYPPDDGTAAGRVDAEALAGAPGVQLVVLDATWRKSLRLLRTHPMLAALPRMALAPAGASRYAALRKAPRPGQLSTLEASCHALARLEGEPARYLPVLEAFERFVADRVRRARPS
jgi:DTW domain-containing protein YfiP